MSVEKTWRVNEVFYSLQGEGVRAGTPNLFIRFAGCNMRCDMEPGEKSPGGFACDTEFESGRSVTLAELNEWCTVALLTTRVVEAMERGRGDKNRGWIILTGGEPALQVDAEFCDYFHKLGYKLAIETNGSIALPTLCSDKSLIGSGGETDLELGLGNQLLDWVTVSPKVAEHAIKQLYAHELKYVRGYGQGIPKTVVQAEHYLISPAFDGDRVHPKTLQWCIKLVLDSPSWRLSVQQHKTTFGGVR